jgi:o-succinylbenzoate synthase
VQIVKAEAIPIRIPLKKPFTIAVGSLTHSNHVLVRLLDDQGREGWGETSTFLEVYGYDQKAVYEALARHLLPAVIGMDPGDMAAINQRMDMVMPHNLMAKAGVDLAAHDLLAQAADLPIHALIGGKRLDRVPLIYAIGMVAPEEAAAIAREKTAQGYNILKIKIGADPRRDIDRVAAVRDAVGDEVLLRVDGNAAYDWQTAISIFSGLDDMGLEWIEQPLPAWDLEGHARLNNRLKTPIALDESVHTSHEAMQAVRMGACSVVNLKLVRCGGFYRSRDIVALCRSAGVACFMGGVLETSPGMAAGAHFYAATPGVVSAAEFDGISYYVDDIVEESIPLSHGGMPVPQSAGLGVAIDSGKLARYRMDL